MSARPPAVAVLGIGNTLRRDDGVGPAAIALLARRLELPDEVPLLDLGTPGLDLVEYLLDLDAAVVVDTVAAADEPGTLRLYERDEIVAGSLGDRLSPHDPSLREALLTAELFDRGPSRVVLIGVVPGSTELGTELTPAVRRALPAVVAAVARQLRAFGVEVRERAPATTPRPLEPMHC